MEVPPLQDLLAEQRHRLKDVADRISALSSGAGEISFNLTEEGTAPRIDHDETNTVLLTDAKQNAARLQAAIDRARRAEANDDLLQLGHTFEERKAFISQYVPKPAPQATIRRGFEFLSDEHTMEFTTTTLDYPVFDTEDAELLQVEISDPGAVKTWTIARRNGEVLSAEVRLVTDESVLMERIKETMSPEDQDALMIILLDGDHLPPDEVEAKLFDMELRRIDTMGEEAALHVISVVARHFREKIPGTSLQIDAHPDGTPTPEELRSLQQMLDSIE